MTYRLITDHLGSVRAVVGVTSGTVAQRIDYDAWGNVTLDTQPGFVSQGYAGGLRDTATGLVRFGARDYDPSVGRWTAKDPIGFAGGAANLYSYVGSAPPNHVDPLGLGASVAQGMHLYNCRQTLQLLQWAREDAAGPYGWYLALQNHAWPGYMDFSWHEPGASFVVPGIRDPLNADAFGNFIAGYAGYYQGGISGGAAALIGGQGFDIFNDWPGPFSGDAESRPHILLGFEYAVMEKANANCNCSGVGR